MRMAPESGMGKKWASCCVIQVNSAFTSIRENGDLPDNTKQVKVELIVPFIKAAHSVFESMINMEIRRKEVFVKKGYLMSGEISGIIGLSGDTTGTCAISLPAELAIECVERLLGERPKKGIDDPDVRDCVGELINMITGHAKTTLANMKHNFNITLPTLISGIGHEIFHRGNTHCVVIVFETPEKQEFTVDVCVAGK